METAFWDTYKFHFCKGGSTIMFNPCKIISEYWKFPKCLKAGSIYVENTEAVVRRCSIKFFTEKHICARVSFLINLQASACNFINKDSGSGVFLWILRNFWEHLFYRTPDKYIWEYLIITGSNVIDSTDTRTDGKSWHWKLKKQEK